MVTQAYIQMNNNRYTVATVLSLILSLSRNIHSKMKYLYIIATVSLFVMVNSACKKDNQANCAFSAPPTVIAPASETAAVQAYLTANSITATQHSSGMFYTILPAAGTGNAPGQCSQISVRYTGRLTNGSRFATDQSRTNHQTIHSPFIGLWQPAGR
jgi:FKBP-type peptidyl-prolyl cis-trans isomerase